MKKISSLRTSHVLDMISRPAANRAYIRRPSPAAAAYNPRPLPTQRAPMNVLFEEDGVFKTGAIVADNDSSLQVDTASGKRVKLKAASVLLRFAAPGAGELLAQAEKEAEGIDTEFLWEV